MKAFWLFFLCVLYSIATQAQSDGIFKRLFADTARAKDYRFTSKPVYSLLKAMEHITGNDSTLAAPSGTTAQRPSVPTGKYIIRYNLDSAALEVGNPAQQWKLIGQSSDSTTSYNGITEYSPNLFGLGGVVLFPTILNGKNNPSVAFTFDSINSFNVRTQGYEITVPPTGGNLIIGSKTVGGGRIFVSNTSNIIQLLSGSMVSLFASGYIDLLAPDSMRLRGAVLSTVLDTSIWKPVTMNDRGVVRRGAYWFGGGGTAGVTAVGLQMPAAFTVLGSPITGADTIVVTMNGTSSQYIRGDGTLGNVGNGLRVNVDTIQLGGTLTNNPIIDGGSDKTVTFTSAKAGFSNSTVIAANTNNGRGITGTSVSGNAIVGNSTSGVGVTGTSSSSNGIFGSSGSGVGVLGISTSSQGVWAQSTSAAGLYVVSTFTTTAATIVSNSSSTNGSQTVLQLYRNSSPSNGANNNAGQIDMYGAINTSPGASVLANRIRWKMTNASAGAEVSAFEIDGINAGVLSRKLSLAGNGQLTLDGYAGSAISSSDSTVYKPTGMDASGNVVRMNYWLGSGGGGGVSGSGVAGQLAYWTGTGTVAGDAGGLYDATKNQVTADSLVALKTTTDRISINTIPFVGPEKFRVVGGMNINGSVIVNKDSIAIIADTTELSKTYTLVLDTTTSKIKRVPNLHTMVFDPFQVYPGSSFTVADTIGFNGIKTMGTANQLFGINSAGTAVEYKTLVAGTNVTINHGTGTITINATGGSSGWSIAIASGTGNYTISGNNFIILSDLTGQANRNVVLPSSPASGDVLLVYNKDASGFNWTFTGGTVKDIGNNTITTLSDLTDYSMSFDGTNWLIIN